MRQEVHYRCSAESLSCWRWPPLALRRSCPPFPRMRASSIWLAFCQAGDGSVEGFAASQGRGMIDAPGLRRGRDGARGL